jgi:ribonuclease BN (tRNA processing enzyme)
VPAIAPTSFTLRMYQVGFGDGFLLSLHYPRPLDDGRAERHVLIDCGSTRRAPEGPSIADVAELIAGHTGGQLDVVVVTHRHRDHLSGFGVKAAVAHLAPLRPGLVIRPWADHPDVAEDATGPVSLGAGSRRFASALTRAQTFADVVARTFEGRRGQQGALATFAADQLPNAAAVETLEGWAEAADAAYVHAGSDASTTEILPGVAVRILGPPTIEQWPQVARQRQDDPEYWLTQRTMLARHFDAQRLDNVLDEAGEETAGVGPPPPGPTRWLVDRLRQQHVASLQRIVRTLDDALNNTSVLMLIDVGDHRLLFTGDAQIENWSYALTHPEHSPGWKQLLADVDVYKVGHHGSRNATPKTLYNLWSTTPDRPRHALLSTLSGVHGKTDATHVPRSALITALRQVTTLHTTEELPPGHPLGALHAPARGSDIDYHMLDHS